MPAFSIQSPYTNQLEPENVLSDSESESDFEIDSNISDADAQELLKELKAVNLATAQRELTDVTLHIQETTWKRWLE